jgi:hypothetical protein
LVAVLPTSRNGGAEPPPEGDYLDGELRTRVERLKVESRQSSVDPDVLRRRLEVLWDWSEAFARDGGVIPPDYPRHWGVAYHATRGSQEPHAQRSVGELVEPGRGVTMELVGEFVRHRVREFALKESRPVALGTLTLSDRGPFVAGDHVTMVQTYTVGEQAMPPGSRFLLAHRRAAMFQADEPAAPGYTTARASRTDIVLARENPSPRWQSAQIYPVAAFRVEGGGLEPGDVVTFTYGDRAQGSPGLRVPTASGDELTLPVFVDLFADGDLLTPAWPSWSVVGRRECRFVNAIVPSAVRPGEPFTLAVRSEDAFKNPVSGGAPAYEVRLGERLVARLEADGPAVSLVENLTIEEPGAHRFEIRAPEIGVAGRSNPVVVDADLADRILWGDTHGHTGLAEGTGSPEAYYRFGRDVARVDFLTLSEHDVWVDAREWQVIADTTEAFLDPGRFTTIFGYEWTASSLNGGHHNVYFRGTRGSEPAPQQWTMNLQQLYGALRQNHRTEDVLIIPHAHMPGDWRENDAAMERAVEITSGHGSWEWFGNRYLRNGFRVGFVGSSDNHAGHPGYSVGSNTQLGGLAAVFAPENTRAAVFDALRARRCYATTGERIVLHAELGGVPMGQQVPFSNDRRLRCRVYGTQPIDVIDVIKNGEVAYSQRYLAPVAGETSRVQILFESSTEIHGEYRGPAWREREWKGAIEVSGARLGEVELPWYHDPRADRLSRSTEGPNRVDFALNTSGRGKGLVLHLDGAHDTTRIVVHLEAASAPPRLAALETETFPALELAFTVADLARRGRASEELRSGAHTDRIEAQLVPTDGALDRVLEWGVGRPR